jgi:hypothetical protein
MATEPVARSRAHVTSTADTAKPVALRDLATFENANPLK